MAGQLGAAVCAALLLGLGAVAPARAADVGLRVTIDGAEPVLVGRSELASLPDRGTLPVTVLDRDGRPEGGATAGGVTAAALVTYLQLDPGQ